MKLHQVSDLALILGCLSMANIAWAPPVHAQEAAQSGDLLKLNQTFGQWYATAKTEIRKKLGPVVIVTDKITLLSRGTEAKEKEYTWLADKYTQMKTIDHGALAVFVALLNHRDETFTPELSDRLKALKAEINKAIDELEAQRGATLLNVEAKRQKMIASETNSFIDRVLSQNKVGSDQLLEYTRNMRFKVMGNVDDATFIDMKSFDQAVVRLKHDLTADEWRSMYVVINSGHMPRQLHTKLQYWLKLLHEPQEGGRVIYFEGPDDREGALELLATHILDCQMAEHFFNDKWRMHRDLLSDAAASYLKKNKIEAATSPFKQ